MINDLLITKPINIFSIILKLLLIIITQKFVKKSIKRIKKIISILNINDIIIYVYFNSKIVKCFKSY